MRSCAALVALLAVLQPLPPVAAQPAERWIAGRTSHFTVFSNADEGSVERLASNLERFVAATSRLLGDGVAERLPATVIAFRDERSFLPFKPLYQGRPSSVSGFFEHSQDETVIALDLSAIRIHHPFAIVFHEYTHLLTSEAGRKWPAWLREGLAEFYSTFLVEGDVVTLGMPVTDHVQVLGEGGLLPLAALLAVSTDSPTYNEGRRRGLFYAQAWVLIHYLSLTQVPGQPFPLRRFVEALAAGQPAGEAFDQTIRRAHPRLEAELRAYVARRIYPVISYRMAVPPSASQFAVAPLGPVETDLQLGRLLLHAGRLDEAEALFARARSRAADEPGPSEAFGLLALRRGQVDAALDELARAIRLGSRHYLAHYAYAKALYAQARDGRISPDQAREIAARAREAVALEPRFLPAWHLMARVYLTVTETADVAAGAADMTAARGLFPADLRIALTLGNLQMQLGEYATAAATLRPVTASTDLNLKVQAEYLLGQMAMADAPGDAGTSSAEPPESGR